MALPQFLSCLVLVLCGLFLVQTGARFFRKLGIVLFWLASGLATFFLTNSVPLSIVALLAWILVPLWEMAYVLRQLRLPRERELVDAFLSAEAQDEVHDVVRSLKEAGFELVDECALRPAEPEQHYCIYVHREGGTSAMIGYVSQGAVGFHFLAFTSHTRDGRRWVTWDYPLAYMLQMPPQVAVYRNLDCLGADELYQAHLDFLKINEITPEDLTPADRTPETVRVRLKQTLNQQIQYNLERGYLAPAQGFRGAGNLCYSWRGMIFVAGQVVRNLLY